MRVALCQIDPTVGDLEGNVALVLRDARRAAEEGADLVVFPELAVCGYPPRDLLDRPSFVRDQRAALDHLVEALPHGPVALVGFAEPLASSVGRGLANAVAVVRDGRVEGVVRKRLLPSYDVFDEDRWFEPGAAGAPLVVAGRRVGVTVCEDIWNDAHLPVVHRRYGQNPVEDLSAAGVDVLVNVAASPFTLRKREGRARMLGEVAKRHGVPVVFVNQVGGNDDILFDGASAVFDPTGDVAARLSAFEEDFAVVTVGEPAVIRPRAESDAGAALDALVMGVRDYARKCRFQKVVLGLSGGIDSALTCAIAAEALGPDNVLGVAMPTRYSSQHSLDDAEALALALGVTYRVVPIDGLFAAYERELLPHLDEVGPSREGEVTFENVQSRIRCAVLMALSNRFGSLLLTTGNKSEVSVGYCTLYGDMAGGLAVISDLPKTFVYQVSREVNRRAGREVIPESTLTKPPSAELRPDQRDSDSLPEYDVLDAILERYVEQHEPVDDIVAAGFDEATVRRVVRLVQVNEYKRRQMPTGLIVTAKAFGPGRRYPIAQGYRR